jgi:hypothetical protein
MLSLRLINRFWNSAVIWTWAFSGFRLASGLLLLPLAIRVLPETDFGMYFLFLFLSTLAPVLDGVLSVTIARNVAYAMRGVRDLKQFGVAHAEPGAGPNLQLLGQLLYITRRAYGWMSFIVFLVLAGGGSFSLHGIVPETSSPFATWTAWWLLVISAPFELYTGSRVAFLRGMNQVLLTARLSTIVYALKLLLSCVLLLAGFGLLGIALAANIAALVQRLLAGYFSRQTFPNGLTSDPRRAAELWRILWPNTWRVGLVVVTCWLPAPVFTTVISNLYGLPASATFSLSWLLLYSISPGIAGTWTSVKWPLITQLRAGNDLTTLRALIYPRLWLQLLTYSFLASLVILFAPPLLAWWSPEKSMLPRFWLSLLACFTLLDMNYAFWTTLISTENRIPSMWATVLSNLAGISLSLLLLNITSLHLGSFILGPLLAGLSFNFWFWPSQGARSIGAGSFFNFMSNRKSLAAST